MSITSTLTSTSVVDESVAAYRSYIPPIVMDQLVLTGKAAEVPDAYQNVFLRTCYDNKSKKNIKWDEEVIVANPFKFAPMIGSVYIPIFKPVPAKDAKEDRHILCFKRKDTQHSKPFRVRFVVPRGTKLAVYAEDCLAYGVKGIEASEEEVAFKDCIAQIFEYCANVYANGVGQHKFEGSSVMFKNYRSIWFAKYRLKNPPARTINGEKQESVDQGFGDASAYCDRYNGDVEKVHTITFGTMNESVDNTEGFWTISVGLQVEWPIEVASIYSAPDEESASKRRRIPMKTADVQSGSALPADTVVVKTEKVESKEDSDMDDSDSK